MQTSVPQGGCLSPTLFSVYINDIPVNEKRNVSFNLLFADDLTASFIFGRHGRINTTVNGYLRKLEKWLFKWRLKMSAKKCCYLVMAKKKQKEDALRLLLNGEMIASKSDPCFLGYSFDSSMTFKNQVQYVRSEPHRRMNCVKVLSHKSWQLTKDTLKTIYMALVRSKLYYSSLVVSRLSTKRLRQ